MGVSPTRSSTVGYSRAIGREAYFARTDDLGTGRPASRRAPPRSASQTRGSPLASLIGDKTASCAVVVSAPVLRSRMEFGVLGPLAVWEDGARASARRGQAACAAGGAAVARERARCRRRGSSTSCGVSSRRATAVKAVQVYVSQLRKVARRGRRRDAAGRLRAPRRGGRARPGAVRGPARAGPDAARGRRGRGGRRRAARARSRSGAGRRWRISSTSRLPATRSGVWRSCGWSRSACGSRPTWRSAAPPRSCRSWRRSCGSIRCASACGSC